MTTSAMRKQWQQFKKEYPEFEKNRRFKTNLGPQMDKLEKSVLQCDRAFATARNLLGQVAADTKAVRASYDAYSAVARELPPAGQKAFRSFGDDLTQTEQALAHYLALFSSEL